jgi:hypothetical protein
MAALSATVQVGDVARSEALLANAVPITDQDPRAEVRVGDAERATSVGLHRLQRGDVQGALDAMASLQEQLRPAIDPNLHSALALAHAADGSIDAALREADEVDGHERATYLDRITAGVARALALSRGGEPAATAAFDQVRAAADATEDRLAQALTRLAEATAASVRGDEAAAALQAEADRRLDEMGLAHTAWRQAYTLAMGVPA